MAIARFLLQKRRGLRAYGTSFGGKPYCLRAHEVPPAGTPQEVIDEAIKHGLVIKGINDKGAPPRYEPVEVPGQLRPQQRARENAAAISMKRGRLRDRIAAARSAARAAARAAEAGEAQEGQEAQEATAKAGGTGAAIRAAHRAARPQQKAAAKAGTSAGKDEGKGE